MNPKVKGIARLEACPALNRPVDLPELRMSRSAGNWLLIVAVVLVGQILFSVTPILAEQEAAVVEEILPPERRPYDVRLLAAFDARRSMRPASKRSSANFVRRFSRTVAGVWYFNASEIRWLAPVNSHGLERLDRSFLADHYVGESADVWFVATVESLRVGTRISVRSWQPEFQVDTSIASTEVIDHREIPVAMLRLCRNLMRPIGVVEQVNDRAVRIRLRAGELVSPDPSFVQMSKGDLLSPMLAYRDKHKVVEKLQAIPWTYISVDDVDASTVTGTVQSGIKLALGGKKRGRIDTIVIKLRTQYPSTHVELLTQSKPILPLVAHRVEVRTQPIIPRVTDDNPNVDPGFNIVERVADRPARTDDGLDGTGPFSGLVVRVQRPAPSCAGPLCSWNCQTRSARSP